MSVIECKTGHPQTYDPNQAEVEHLEGIKSLEKDEAELSAELKKMRENRAS